MSGHVERATCTYAIARRFHPSHLWGVRGVDCTAVHLVHHGDLAAVVGTMSFTKADEAALRARLESPAELETIARAHRGVVNAVFEHTVTLPFRLATIHQSEQRVVEILRAGHERFCSALAQLDGRVEVGVKIYSDVVASSLASVGRGDGAHSDGSADPGRDSLRRRRQQLHDQDGARRGIAAAAARIGDTLARLSVDHRNHRPLDPRFSGVTEENVLNAAYLIDGASIDAFAALGRSLEVDRAATRVELTGPRPPYSFIEPIDPQCSPTSPSRADQPMSPDVSLVDLLDRTAHRWGQAGRRRHVGDRRRRPRADLAAGADRLHRGAWLASAIRSSCHRTT